VKTFIESKNNDFATCYLNNEENQFGTKNLFKNQKQQRKKDMNIKIQKHQK